MRKHSVILVFASLFFLLTSNLSFAQYFKFDNLTDQQIGNVIQNKEVEAILKLFGSFIGSGMLQTGGMHGVGGVDVGIKGVVTTVPSEFKGLPVFATGENFGLAFLHGSVGLPGNFELFGRFFYFPLGDDITDVEKFVDNAGWADASDSRGGVTLIGGGLKYGLLQLPVGPKVTVMGAYHAVMVPEEFDFGTVSTFSIKGIVSQSLAIITLFAGAGVDFTRLTIDDDLDSALQDFAGESFSESGLLYTVGAKASVFPFIHVSGALNFGEFNSFDLGLGVSIR